MPDEKIEFGKMQYRNQKIEELLRDIGSRLQAATEGTGYGFALLLMKFGEDGGTFYASNAQRDSVIEMMEEFISKARRA